MLAKSFNLFNIITLLAMTALNIWICKATYAA